MKKVLALHELPQFCKEMQQILGEGGIVLLRGTLASGKTTFVSEFAKVLGLHVAVSSPTFSQMHEYGDKIMHYDIYQKGLSGFLQSGLLEGLDAPKYHFIEWADEKMEQMLRDLGFTCMVVAIEICGDKRVYEVKNA